MTSAAAPVPASWWDLDETSGPRAWAWGPVQNHGTYVGSPTLGGAAAGVTFNGTSQYINVPANTSLDVGGPDQFTDYWALWCVVKRGATGAIRSLVSKGPGAPQLRLDATGKPQLLLSGGTVLATAPAALDTNAHAVLATKEGDTAAIYVDGVSVVQVATSAYAATNSHPLRIGADTSAGGAAQQFFNGTLYAAAVYNGNMSGAALLPSHTAGNYLAASALLSAYRDPADAGNVTAQLPVWCAPGDATVVSCAWTSSNNVPGGGSGSIGLDGAGRGTLSLPVAPAMNGQPIALTIGVTTASGTINWATTVYVDWSLARLAPNVALGDNVANLAGGAPAMLPNPALPALSQRTDQGATFYRAMVGPAPTDYAPGSSWQASAAACQAQLPARGAYLAAQLQLVRQAT